MTNWIEVEDVPQGRIFLAGGDKWLLLDGKRAVNMNGHTQTFAPDTRVRLADKGATITIKQA